LLNVEGVRGGSFTPLRALAVRFPEYFLKAGRDLTPVKPLASVRADSELKGSFPCFGH
jgi:hypothetical protein